MRVGRASNVAPNTGQIKTQHTLVLGGLHMIGPKAGGFGIGLHQRHLLVAAPGKAQIVGCLLVNVEHGSAGTEFRCHVGYGGPIA